MQKEKEEIKLSLFADMVIHRENPKESTKENLLELVNSVRCQNKRSAHKNNSHFYTPTMNNRNKMIPFTITQKKMKYLGIH